MHLQLSNIETYLAYTWVAGKPGCLRLSDVVVDNDLSFM